MSSLGSKVKRADRPVDRRRRRARPAPRRRRRRRRAGAAWRASSPTRRRAGRRAPRPAARWRRCARSRDRRTAAGRRDGPRVAQAMARNVAFTRATSMTRTCSTAPSSSLNRAAATIAVRRRGPSPPRSSSRPMRPANAILDGGDEQPAVRAIVIGQQLPRVAQLAHRREEAHQRPGIVQVGRGVRRAARTPAPGTSHRDGSSRDRDPPAAAPSPRRRATARASARGARR